jgi:hypothetical protein
LGLAFASSGTFDFVVPQIPQATFSILTSASPQNAEDPDNSPNTVLLKRGLTAGTTNAALVIPAPARPAQPADAAKDVTRTTEFSWSSFTNGVHQLLLQEDKSENQTPYTVTIYTSGTQTTLPDLSAFGMDLPANTEFTWQVQGVGPVASLDTLIGLVEQGNPLEQGTGDFSVSTSETRSPGHRAEQGVMETQCALVRTSGRRACAHTIRGPRPARGVNASRARTPGGKDPR